MKKSRFSDSQIVGILKQSESGTPVPALCREHGISSATFYKWRSKNSHLGQFGYGYLGDTGQLVSSILAGTPVGHHYGYEPNAGDRRLKEIRHPQAARSFAYTNAPSFIITAITETFQGQSVAWDFTYDEINRLQTAKRGDGQHYQYSFDKGDNLTLMAGPGGTRAFRPSLGNKLNQAHYQHDPVGNRIADDRHRYTWDAENRLIKIAYKNDPQRQTEFRYDGQSRRVAIIETDGAKRVETKYTWCGNAICQARDAQGRPVAYYFSQGVYRPQAKGNKKEYYAKDHLGSIRDVLDEKGSPIARYDYDPYGSLTSDPSKPPEFGYAGMHYHAQSGLYLTKYRAYDPQSGRWLSRDPIEEAGGINLYAYVGGNPVSFIDLLGLLVTGTFDVATGIVTLTDMSTHQTVYGEFFSGQKDSDGNYISLPIPNGVYDILEHPTNGFFRLEPLDSVYGDDKHEGTGRTLFRLHKPGASIGCITSDDASNWAMIESFILGTETSTATVQRKGFLGVTLGLTEQLIRYGTITVINSPN